MIEVIFAGSVPNRLKAKAGEIIKSQQLRVGYGWKKINGLRDCFSYRLNNNYRVLRPHDGPFLVCNHDLYQKKIRNLKKQE